MNIPKRLCALLLCVLLLLPLCGAMSVSAHPAFLIPQRSLPKNLAAEACVSRLCASVSGSIVLLRHALKTETELRFSSDSAFSVKLSRSKPLQLLAFRAYRKGPETYDGSLSFYGTGDMEYAIGWGKVHMTFERENGVVYAVCVVSDRYDFDGIRSWDSVSNLLNNIGYLLQESERLYPYNWSATVRIAVHTEKTEEVS